MSDLMNRIYQGKVANVEIRNAKGEWEALPEAKWQDALWQHHQPFQAESDEMPLTCAANAFNYYSLALAALA